jgi:hypothetical protein
MEGDIVGGVMNVEVNMKKNKDNVHKGNIKPPV